MKKKIMAAAIAAVVMFASGGCAENSVGGNETLTNEGASDSVGEVTANEETEAATENVTEVTTEGETENTAKAEEETVIIAGQEFPVNAERVDICISEDIDGVTDISALGRFNNLKKLCIYSGGGWWNEWKEHRIDGLDVLAGCETLENIQLGMWPVNDEDWHILETLPNLKYLKLETEIYEGFDLELPTLETFVFTTTEMSDNVTDISAIKGFKNLKSLYIDRVSDGGGHYTVDGLDVLAGSEAIEDVVLAMWPENNEDWHILETLPNLTDLSLYFGAPDDFSFNIPSLEYLGARGLNYLSNIDNLTNLRTLSLDACGDYTGKSDDKEQLSHIVNLKNLVQLKMTRCFFTDYSGLLESDSIKYLTIKGGEPISEELYNELCEKFPDCDITIRN